MLVKYLLRLASLFIIKLKTFLTKDPTVSYEQVWIRFVALSLLVLGAINIFSAIFSFDDFRSSLVRSLFSYSILRGSRTLVLVTGVVTFLVAPALYRGKRTAWFFSVFILAASGIGHLMKGADIEESALCILILGILLPLYKYCRVKSDPIKTVKGGGLLLFTVIFVITYTFVGVHFFSDAFGFDRSLTPFYASIQALFFNLSMFHPQTKSAHFFITTLLFINSVSLITGTLYFLSPVIIRKLDNHSYQDLAQNHGEQIIQFLSASNDYRHFFIEEKELKGLINYTISKGVVIVLGNPLVLKGEKESLYKRWYEYCLEHDWILGAYQVDGDYAHFLKRKNYITVSCGVEAAINLGTFSLSGKSKQSLRSALNKGKTSSWNIKTFDESDFGAVKELNQRWLDIHGGKENSFGMGSLSLDYLLKSRTRVVYDHEMKLLAYANFIDLPGEKLRAVDLMRRNPEAPSGAIEFLFVLEIERARDEGFLFFDLGFSPLSMIDPESSEDKPVSKLFTLIYEKQKRIYDFRGLHNFKSKYAPDWKPLYLLYPRSPVSKLSVLIALFRLNSKGGKKG
jgi:phosphatidylglycerol lysyltransferase